MAAPAAVLSILVRANTGSATTGLLRVNQQLSRTEAHSKKVARAIEGVAKGFALVGGGAAAAGIAFAVKKAADFEQQMSSLGSVTDATGKQMDRFRKQALRAGAETKFSALEAAKAQTELAKGGLTVSQIMKGGLKSALALAAAGEMELADAASTTVNAMKLFGLRGKAAMKVADGFATAANRTTADVSDFALALQQGGSAAKTAGLSFQETVTALEALAEVGVKGSDAGTSLKTALIQLASPSSAKARETAKKLGIEVFDTSGKMKSLVDVSEILQKSLGGLTQKQRIQAATTLVGQDGFRALLALYDAGPRKIAKMERELNKQGTAAEVARKKQDNLKGSLENLGGSVETLGIQVGTAMLPAIRTASAELTRFANDVGKIVSRKDLSLGEKLQKSLDLAKVRAKPWIDKLEEAIDRANIPQRLGDLISGATPIIVKAMAKGGLAAAKTFAGAFASSDVWGKLVLGGWLLSRMGGKAGFFKMGAIAGTSFGEGMAVTGGGMGLLGKLKGVLGGLRGLAGKVVALDVGVNLVDSKGNLIAAAINTAHDLTFGIVPKVKVPTGNERAQASIAGVGKELDAALKSRSLSGIENVTNKIKAMADEARSFGRTDLAGQLNKLADSGSAKLQKLSESEHKAAGMSGRFADAIRGLRLRGSKDFDGLVHQVTFGSRQILRVGGKNSELTQQAISHQFDLARKRVQTAMDRKVVSVKKGTQLLHTLAVKELGLYGIKAGKVDVVLAKGANGQMRPNARGGFQAGGKPTGDSIPSLLERGEYVVNRKAVRKVGKRNLDRLNFGMAPRFQSGGMVDPAWDPGTQRINAAISGRVGAWAKRFQADMTAGFDPGGGHVSPGHNVTGTATDMVPLGGNWDLLEKGLRLLVNSGLKVLYGTNGVGMPWPNHGRGNHAHIEWGLGGGPSVFDGLKRVMLAGTPSAGLLAGQAVLDRVRGAANASINQAIGFTTESGEAGFGAPAVKGSGAGLMKAISQARGWSFPDWWALDASETGHGANLANPTSTARLRGQFLDMNWGKYGPGSDPRQNPSMAEQIQSMAQYIAERYGNPTRAWAFHRAHNYYAKGGLVGMAKGGLAGAVGKTLRKVRTGKSPKIRQAAIHKLIDRIKKSGNVGLPQRLQDNLKKYGGDANMFGEYADRAASLTTDDANGNPLQASVKGKTQAQWLADELTALWHWRNAILKAEKIIRDRREKIAAAIEVARKRFRSTSEAIKTAAKTRKDLERQLAKAQKHPKQNQGLIKGLRGKMKDIDQAQRPRRRLQDALKDRIIPALTGKQSNLTALRGTLLDNLTEAQGLGSSMTVMKKMPVTPGLFGGRIFDVQMQLRDLNAPKAIVTDDSGDEKPGVAEALELLRQANLRTAVSEAQYKVFEGMPQFATGGIVQGVSGAAVPAVVHAGEGVFTRDQMAAMGGGGDVHVHFASGMEWLKQFVSVEVDRGTRRNARIADRRLPGRGGGSTR